MMKSILIAAAVTAFSAAGIAAADTETSTDNLSVRIPILDRAVFYDGYQSEVYDADKEDGILRHSNSLYAVRLTDEQLDMIGSQVGLEVTIGALCDDFDRIGATNIALVPKGSKDYKFADVERIEIARFITPFMNKNRMPNEVPFNYVLPDLELVLRDKALREKYDFWFEFDIFGVPYDANKNVTGCRGRNDVFEGSATLVTTPQKEGSSDGHILIPVYTRRQEQHGNVNFNNYKENATDTIGVTTRTFEINLPKDVEDSKVTFILTNHGAAKGGEEYIRRLHLVYFDGDVKMAYTPGGVSCEPYRQYNTMPNSIYQTTAQPEEYWETISNWCPGQAVPVREIHTGALKAGIHKFMIRVPDAEFVGEDGDFRPSIYFQGLENGLLAAGVTDIVAEEKADISFSLDDRTLRIDGADIVASLAVYTPDGQLVYGKNYPGHSLILPDLGSGMHIFVASTPEGRTTFDKIILH